MSRRPAARTLTASLAALALTAALGVTAAGAAPSAPYCGLTWGSTPESAAFLSPAPLTAVRTGQQPCFDRLVLDVAGPAGGYDVSYVPVVTQEGSGAVIPTRGGAALQVVAHVPAYDSAGRATYAPADPRELAAVGGYRTFRQVVWAGSFEGDSTVGIGVRARLPFRVFTLAGPGTGSRLVVDVAHRW